MVGRLIEFVATAFVVESSESVDSVAVIEGILLANCKIYNKKIEFSKL